MLTDSVFPRNLRCKSTDPSERYHFICIISTPRKKTPQKILLRFFCGVFMHLFSELRSAMQYSLYGIRNFKRPSLLRQIYTVFQSLLTRISHYLSFLFLVMSKIMFDSSQSFLIQIINESICYKLNQCTDQIHCSSQVSHIKRYIHRLICAKSCIVA